MFTFFVSYLGIYIVKYWEVYVGNNNRLGKLVFFPWNIERVPVGLVAANIAEAEAVGGHHHFFYVVKRVERILVHAVYK